MFGIVAWAVMGLEDSHTLFLPPARVDRVQYGWELAMVGDTCFVIDADPDVSLAPDRPAPVTRYCESVRSCRTVVIFGKSATGSR